MKKTNKLKELVKGELTLLKEVIPQEALQKLKGVAIYPQNDNACIYGRLFGSSKSPMATFYRNMVAVPYSSTVTVYTRSRKKKVDRETFTPLEYYIAEADGGVIRNIVEFLVEERKILIL